MSGSNQHVMQINLRRMERSDFTELPSHDIKTKRRRAEPPGRCRGGKGTVPLSVPLFEGKPLVACINALLGILARHL